MRALGFVALATALGFVAVGSSGCHDSNGGGDGGVGPDMAQPPYYGNCTAPARPPSGVAFQLTDAFPGRTFAQPVGMAQAPGDPGHFFVWEQGGHIQRVDATGSAAQMQVGDVTAAPEGNLVSGGEAGLLGLAFSPKWQTNHTAYLSFTPASGTAAAGFKSFLARVTTAADGSSFDVAHEQPLLSLDQPYTNHNGGNIAFGPDGYLYFGFGDGGSRRRSADNARRTSTRCSARSCASTSTRPTARYAIPPTTRSPAAAAASARDLRLRPAQPVALELRSRDRRAVVRRRRPGRVGRGRQHRQIGGNYGWNTCEGTHCYDADARLRRARRRR